MRRMKWVSEEDKYVPYGAVILVDVGLLEEKPHLGKWLQNFETIYLLLYLIG